MDKIQASYGALQIGPVPLLRVSLWPLNLLQAWLQPTIPFSKVLYFFTAGVFPLTEWIFLSLVDKMVLTCRPRGAPPLPDLLSFAFPPLLSQLPESALIV